MLRAFAVERWIRAFVLGLLGYAVLQFRSSESSLEQTFDRILPSARPLAQAFDLDIDHSPAIARIHRLLQTDPRTLTWIAVGLFAYAGLQVAEGVGLWSLKRWGEYLAVVATSVFLPVEIYELHEKVTWLRLGAFLVNLALVGYLAVEQAALRGARGRDGVRRGAARGLPPRRRGRRSRARLPLSCHASGQEVFPQRMTRGPSLGGVYRFLGTPRWIAATLATLLAIGAFVALGSWQWHRAKTRDTPHVVDGTTLPPVPVGQALGTSLRVEPGTPARAVTAAGHYDGAHQVLVPGRALDGRDGTYVLTPLLGVPGLGSDGLVVLRGWVAGRPTTAPAAPSGDVTLNGWLVGRRGPQRPGRQRRPPRGAPGRAGRHDLDAAAAVAGAVPPGGRLPRARVQHAGVGPGRGPRSAAPEAGDPVVGAEPGLRLRVVVLRAGGGLDVGHGCTSRGAARRASSCTIRCSATNEPNGMTPHAATTRILMIDQVRR